MKITKFIILAIILGIVFNFTIAVITQESKQSKAEIDKDANCWQELVEYKGGLPFKYHLYKESGGLNLGCNLLINPLPINEPTILTIGSVAKFGYGIFFDPKFWLDQFLWILFSYLALFLLRKKFV